jgi:PST family polysaccharide transporter
MPAFGFGKSGIVINDADSERDAEPAARTIGRAAGKGLRWSLMGNVSTRLGTLLLGIALARLLTPADFGLYAIALSAMYFAMHVNDVGIIAATVQWRGRLEEMMPTATTLALTFSLVGYGFFWVVAPSFAALAGSPEATPVVRLLTAVILIDGLTAVRVASLLRSFRQDRLMIANLCGLVVNAGVAILLAVRGAGPFSFAGGQVAGAVVTGIFVLWSARVPMRFGFDRAITGRLMRFGVPLALSLGVEAVLLNADYVMVGRALGVAALGFYLLAFNVSSWAPGVIGTAIRWVSVPSFSRLAENEGSLSPGVQRSFTLLFTGVLPIAVLTAVLAPALVEFLYGGKWAPAAPALRFLVLLGAVRMLTQLAVDVLTSAGATRATLWLNLGWAAALVPALVIGIRLDGIRGAAIAHALVGLLVAVPLAVGALRHIGVRLGPVVPTLVRPVLAGVLSASACMLVAELTSSSFLELLAAGSAGLLAYVVAVVPFDQLRAWGGRATALLPDRSR